SQRRKLLAIGQVLRVTCGRNLPNLMRRLLMAWRVLCCASRESYMRLAPASLFLPLVGCVLGEETPPPRLYPIGAVEMASAPPATLPTTTCVPLLQADHIDRPVEVIAIFDIPALMGRENDALAQLRACAAAVGAHAVLGVQFHPGDADEPTYLSGVAVRFL